MKILICYGTRPEYIKIKPLLNKFKESNISFRTLNVRQHENLVKDEADHVVFLRDVSISKNRLDLILSTVADIEDLFYDVLAKISNEIINRVKGINRVVYDISSKPPATIEWE